MHLLCGIHVFPGLKSLWPQQVVHCLHHSLNEQGEGLGRGKGWGWCHESPHILVPQDGPLLSAFIPPSASWGLPHPLRQKPSGPHLNVVLAGSLPLVHLRKGREALSGLASCPTHSNTHSSVSATDLALGHE